MIFQRVVKGIRAATATDAAGLTDNEARAMVAGAGLLSNWWRNAPGGLISPPEIEEKLTEQALHAHLVKYDRVRETTPFISTTAGTVEREAAAEANVYFPPMYTALRFATDHFSQDGYVVHAYVFVLGRKSVELVEFAEELRDLNLYTGYYRWHPEGEIVAKVHIPARRIEKVERYSHAGLEEALDNGEVPAAADVFRDPRTYRDPFEYANVRGFPEDP
jgi:hypothetical protein